MEKIDLAHKRRTYFIEKKFQLQFITKFCFLVILGGFVTAGLVYFLSRQATTVAIVNSRIVVRSTADFLLPLLIQTVAVAVVLTGCATIAITLFVSHRIAGPLFRFKRIMEAMERGDFSRGFRLRTKDQLQDFAESMNKMLRVNREQIVMIQELTKILKHACEKISDTDVVHDKATSLHELKSAVRELAAVTDRYKT
jgi:signal transduction histidine kinase